MPASRPDLSLRGQHPGSAAGSEGSPGLVRSGMVTYLFAGLTLVANLIASVVTARALGPDGRGVTVALVTVTQLAGFLCALGVAQSLSYYIARRPQDGPSLLTTWVLMLLPLTAVAIAVTELLLPTIFAEAGEQAVEVGRWYVFAIVLVVALELNYGLLLGTEDFLLYNALRLAQPVLTTASLLILWLLDRLTVESTLIAAIAASVAVLAVGLGRAVARIGVGPLAPALGLRAAWYGIRGQGSTVANNVTARLDVAMLPAFVSAGSVGLYSVATNLSLIVYQLSNTFAGLLLPSAARDPERGPIKVLGSLWASLLIAALAALALALFAGPLLGLVYGDAFRDAAEPLVLLLPGSVLFAGSSILAAGVFAAGRPLTATLAQVLGMVVTVVGLSVFLSSGGTTAAALVSSAAYATICVAMLVAYKTVSGLRWASFVPTPARVRALL